MKRIKYIVIVYVLCLVLFIISIKFNMVSLFFIAFITMFICSYLMVFKLTTSILILIILLFYSILRIVLYLGTINSTDYPLLPVDSVYSYILSSNIISTNRIILNGYHDFSRLYSNYPLPFIYASSLSIISNIPILYIASFFYSFIADYFSLILIYLLMKKLMRYANKQLFSTTIMQISSVSTLVFLVNVRFLYLFRQFRYENLAFLMFLIVLYSVIKIYETSLKKNDLLVIIISCLATSLSHHFTSLLTLLALISSIIYIHLVHKNCKDNHNVFSFLIGIMTIIFTLIYFNYYMHIPLLNNIYQSITGEFYIKFIGKYNPYNYSFVEITLIILGTIIIAGLIILGFYKLFTNKNVNHKFKMLILAYYLPIILLTVFIIFFTKYRVTIIERNYLYLLIIGGFLAGFGVSEHTLIYKKECRINPLKLKKFIFRKKKSNNVFLFLFLVMMLIFAISQLIIRHQYEIVERDKVNSYRIVASGLYVGYFKLDENLNMLAFPPNKMSYAVAFSNCTYLYKQLDPMSTINKIISGIELENADILIYYKISLDEAKKYVPPFYLKEFYTWLKETIIPNNPLIYSDGQIQIYYLKR